MYNPSAIVISTGTANFAPGIIMFDDNAVFLPLAAQIPKLLRKFSALIMAGEMAVIFREIDLVRREGYIILQPATMITKSPTCDVCGSITVRTGQVYRCLNCGSKMGI